jgi:uncharacterized phage-associated protein
VQLEGPAYSLDPQSFAAYCRVLEKAKAAHTSITRTKIAKLLYLADLEAVRDGHAPITRIEWKWLEHGPYNNALMFVENELVDAGKLERETVQYPSYRGTHLRLVKCDHQDLSAEAEDHLDEVFEAFGRLGAKAIKDVAYETAPMRAAQAGGAREVVLDLQLARPKLDREGLRTRYAPLLARDPEDRVPTDPGDDSAVEAMEEHGWQRRHATSELIGR